jgi:hypothetical protein
VVLESAETARTGLADDLQDVRLRGVGHRDRDRLVVELADFPRVVVDPLGAESFDSRVAVGLGDDRREGLGVTR